MKPSPLAGKRILITGASMGIGEAIARAFARRGAHLILAARSEEKLKTLSTELSKPEQPCLSFKADLTREDDLNCLAEFISNQGGLDGVVHNAGMILYDKFEDTSEEAMRCLFEINFFSILKLTQKILPFLKQSPSPTLAVISSAASFRALPRWSLYCASKAALTLWMESIRLELKPYGIRCVTIYPGVTQTELSAHSPSQGPKPYGTQEGKGSSPEEVAEKTARAFEKGRRDEYVILFNRIYRRLCFHFPSLMDFIFERQSRKKGWL